MKNWPVENMKLEDLTPADYNPRTIKDEALYGLGNSIDRFGMVQPVVWNKRTGNIVGGHQRYKLLAERGETKTDVVVVDLSREEEVALNVTLNNPAVQGDFDNSVGDLLGDVEESIGSLFYELNFEGLVKKTIADAGNIGDDQASPEPEGSSEDSPNSSSSGSSEYMIEIYCESEDEREELFGRLYDDGLNCRKVQV